MVQDETIEKLRGFGLNDRQVVEVMFLIADMEKDAERTRERRKRDAEAQKQRRSSLPKKPNNLTTSADIGRQEQERMWKALVEGEARNGYWPSKRVLKADIPADFIAKVLTDLSHRHEAME